VVAKRNQLNQCVLIVLPSANDKAFDILSDFKVPLNTFFCRQREKAFTHFLISKNLKISPFVYVNLRVLSVNFMSVFIFFNQPHAKLQALPTLVYATA
jgi:hypothetical protein